MIASQNPARVLMLTASGATRDRVAGLELGADGRAVSAEELLVRVWGQAANPFTTTVKTTIARLRQKLGDPPLIETVREGGYRI